MWNFDLCCVVVIVIWNPIKRKARIGIGRFWLGF